MIYNILEIESLNGSEKHIVVEVSEKVSASFPAKNDNKSYLSFLRQLSEENPDDPHYQEWLSKGNNPEDFWTQEEI